MVDMTAAIRAQKDKLNRQREAVAATEGLIATMERIHQEGDPRQQQLPLNKEAKK